MIKLLCILLLACPLFGQTTHTTASVEGNNTFTGTNTFQGVSASSVSVSGAVTAQSVASVIIADQKCSILNTFDLTCISNAVAACPTVGNCVIYQGNHPYTFAS